jgi:RNA polymerase sigma-70 factor (ECF subfamily)
MTDLSGCRPPAFDLERQLEAHRRELTGFCYRMLGSGFEAEDAVQESMLRAWKGIGSYEGRAAFRSWIYRIATNVCLDMLRGRQRRARPIDLGPASPAEIGHLGGKLPENLWVSPIPGGSCRMTMIRPSWPRGARPSGWPSSRPSSSCRLASGPC